MFCNDSAQMWVPGDKGKHAIVLTSLGPQCPVYFSSDSLSSCFLHVLEPTIGREEMQLVLKTTDTTLKSIVDECDCSDFLYGYVHEPQPTLCFNAMLLLRIKSMNDKGDAPRQQGKGQNEYKRVLILHMVFII